MTDTSEIDVRDLNSVRAAKRATERADVVLGDDFIAPDSTVDREIRLDRERRRRINLRGSPLARKIVMFNLIGLMILVIGILYLNPARDSLAFQRAESLTTEAQLAANVVARALPEENVGDLAATDAVDLEDILAGLAVPDGTEALLFDQGGNFLAAVKAETSADAPPIEGLLRDQSKTVLTDALTAVWDRVSGLISTPPPDTTESHPAERVFPLVEKSVDGTTQVKRIRGQNADRVFAAATPVLVDGGSVGVLALITPANENDMLVRQEREQVLQVFVIAFLVSIGLSLVLASAIANPISDLAAAAEMGRAKNARKNNSGRIRIPDLTGRPDEIGRLSGALRGMVGALYDRIDSNEQFAADVAHEIKNPLASLRSATGTLRLAKKEEQRDKLLDVIEHDVRRLDRLVSDISNASRLDSELVKEEEETFNLTKMVGNLTEYLGQQAREKGIDFVEDLPSEPVMLDGLEGRLAQVFVNLITNAISFCEDGDAIRVWSRTRGERVLVVVEDTGPGIPDNALTKVFKRFYSERPEGQFGNNSGLGLAISKQIVEAHGGVIWAENIRPPGAGQDTAPLGARFVVGLPL